MSSAILYVAIVVIWAAVLIPRWLRRDSTATAAAEAAEAEDLAGGAAGGLAEEDAGVERAPVRVPEGSGRRRREAARERQFARGEPVEYERVVSGPVPSEAGLAEPGLAEAGPSDAGQRRVLAARRRLLLMLLALSVASGVLAETRMAAWWVIVPPSVMLLGYMLLLREAAKADTERREMGRYRMDRAAAERRSVPVGSVAHVAPVVADAAPAAKIIAFLPPAEERIYDQYADAKRRAVGD